MPALKDLTGQKIGRWTVLKKAPSKNKKVYWLCQCDCGTIKEVRGESLILKKSLSCGCLHREKSAIILSEIAKKNKKDLTGQKFGKLTVLKETSNRAANGTICWLCQCDCGNQIEVSSGRLLKNNVTHCGCETILSKGEEKIKQILLENNIPFETQKIFSNCRFPSGHPARFDFFINDTYLIEFDGIQHSIYSKSNKSWNTKEKVLYTQEHDNFKNEWCKNNKIPLIRIPYTYYEKISINDLLLNSQFRIV